MRISIFTKYIAKSLLTFFVAVVGILTLVIFMNHFIRVLNMAMAYGTGFGWIVSSLLNILPQKGLEHGTHLRVKDTYSDTVYHKSGGCQGRTPYTRRGGASAYALVKYGPHFLLRPG